MSEEESRYITNQDVEQAYLVAVEQVIVEMLQITGVEDGTPSEVLDRAKSAGYEIQRKIIEPWEHELIMLVKDDAISHIGHVLKDGQYIKHVILTAEEFQEHYKLKEEN